MAEFKRKPMAAELTAALKAGVRDIPSAIVEPERDASKEGKGAKTASVPKAPATVQVNFNASEEFAEMIAELAQEAGSTRRLMARMFREAGHEVPQADLQPFDNRRRTRRH